MVLPAFGSGYYGSSGEKTRKNLSLTKGILMKARLVFAALVIPVMQVFTQEDGSDSAQTRVMLLDTLSKPVKLDVKTGLGDKEKSKLAKAGLIAYLKQTDWAEVVNLGETYALWIENCRQKLRGNSILFELDLELRSRADIGPGRLLATRHIADTVDMSDLTDLKTFQERELFRLIEKKLSKRISLKSLISIVGGAAARVAIPGPGTLIQGGLNNFSKALEKQCTADEAVEGMVIGAVLVTQTKGMLNDVMTRGKK
jgi:hypothetical protein